MSRQRRIVTMYKLIAIDMDDTLLGTDLKISGINYDAIQKARKVGAQVVICSGRSTDSLWPYIKELDLVRPGEYTISYNGAVIVENGNQKKVFYRGISKEFIEYILRITKDWDVDVQLYEEDDLIIEKITDRVQEYIAMTGMKPRQVKDLRTAVKEDTIKILINGEHEVLEEIATKIKPWTERKAHMFFSKPNYLELVNVEANKGLAVLHLAKELGIKQEEIMTIGDSFNDLYMIEAAGMGVAVANAHKDIQKVADYVTQNTHENHAVAEAIQKFILDNKNKRKEERKL